MQSKPTKGTKRGIFIVDKAGKVLAWLQGGPQLTADACKAVVDGMESEGGDPTGKEDKAVADVAGEVADTAAGLDE